MKRILIDDDAYALLTQLINTPTITVQLSMVDTASRMVRAITSAEDIENPERVIAPPG